MLAFLYSLLSTLITAFGLTVCAVRSITGAGRLLEHALTKNIKVTITIYFKRLIRLAMAQILPPLIWFVDIRYSYAQSLLKIACSCQSV